MKILYINTAYYGGGAEKVARQLYEGLNKEYDVETFFLAGKAKKSKEVEVIYGNRIVSKVINEIVSRTFTGIRYRDVYSTKRIINIIQREKIDIVHLHNVHGNFLGIEDINIISQYCKVVWTLHDMWVVTGHCAYPVGCNGWYKDDCIKCNSCELYPPIKYDVANKLLLSKKKSFTDNNICFITPSKWLLEQLNKTYLRNENIQIIENGVNLEQFIVGNKTELKGKYNIPVNKTTLIFSATDICSPYKGADVLVEALRMLPEKQKYFLIIVGKGKIPEEMSQLDYIQTGLITDEKTMNEYLGAADVFIIPSRAENFPCSVLESMASGTPVIGSNVGGIGEQIDSKTGWLFENGNANDLCNKLKEVGKNKNLLITKGKECRRKVESFFSEQKMLQSYYELYKRIIS